MAGDGWRWSWPDGHLALWIPEAGPCRATASLARPGHDLVVLDDDDVPRPRAGWEVRASGLWTDAIEEEPGVRWTIGLEAFALAVDDPGDTIGRRVPLGFDLEWERTGADTDGATPAHVYGEVLVEDAELTVDTVGRWTAWGGEGGHH